MEKNDILNSDWAVRSSAAGNPNIPGVVLKIWVPGAARSTEEAP